MILRTDNYVVKSLKSCDLTDDYYRWINDDEVTRHLFLYGRHPTREEANRHVDSYDEVNNYFFGIYDLSNKLIGTHSFTSSKTHYRCGLGVMIGDKDYWGKNVVLEVRSAVLDFAFYEHGCVKADAGCYKDNIPALYNFKRLGWTLEGVRRSHRDIDGKREDLVLFGMLKEEWDGHRKE